MPYGERILADRALRRMEGQFGDASHKIDVARLFGDEWSNLANGVKRRVQFDTNMALGNAGEGYATELARAADPKTAAQIPVQLPKAIPGSPKKRVYDFAKRDLFDGIREDIVGNLSRMMGKTAAMTDKPVAHFEVKTGAAVKRAGQRTIDKSINADEQLARTLNVKEVRDMRVFPDQIPAHFVIAEFQDRLPGLLHDRIIDRQTGDALVNALKRKYAEGSQHVSLDDYVGLISRLVATAPRYSGADINP